MRPPNVASSRDSGKTLYVPRKYYRGTRRDEDERESDWAVPVAGGPSAEIEINNEERDGNRNDLSDP